MKNGESNTHNGEMSIWFNGRIHLKNTRIAINVELHRIYLKKSLFVSVFLPFMSMVSVTTSNIVTPMIQLLFT